MPVRLFVTSVLIASSLACGRGSDESVVSGEVIAVTVQPVRRGSLKDVVGGAGTVVPSAIADQVVFANESSEIAELTRKEGDKVQSGDVLVRLEVASITNEIAARQLEFAEATTRFEKAKAEEAKLNQLHSQGLAARNQWEAARLALSNAESQLGHARTLLDAAKATQSSATIRARFSGVVAKRWHAQGDLVAGGEHDPILRVIDPTQLQVALQIPADKAERILPGQAATVQADAQSAAATVAMKNTAAGAVPMADVRLAFVGTSTSPLSLDAIVQAEIVLEERANVLVVPASAIQRTEGVTFVWVATETNQAAKRAVGVGLSANGLTEITSGLAEGDAVIVTGIAQLTEGIALTISKGQ